MDIKNGRCVRLYQGDYEQETVFSENPVEVALRWQSMGAPRIHVVDLDGAARGEVHNIEIIKEIAGAILVPVQVGGGIRSLRTIGELLRAGVDRVILGTVAVENPEIVTEACRLYQDSIVAGLDAKDGKIATRGWLTETDLEPVEYAKSLVKLGVRRFIFTDISRDGTLTEPNFTAISEIISALRVPVIASGGVSKMTHLRILKQLGAEGAIIGRALYTGDINLKQALREI